MLLLCRHGQSSANAAGLLLGRADPPLTELGARQAEALAGHPALAAVTRVVSSPLGRAHATASAVASARQVPVEVDERWLELDYGELDLLPVRDVPPATWAAWRADIEWTPPGGESLASLGRRVRPALEELAEQARTVDVAVFSHVSPLKAALAWALDVGDEVAWRIRLDPACVNVVAVTPAGATVSKVNDTSHLLGLA